MNIQDSRLTMKPAWIASDTDANGFISVCRLSVYSWGGERRQRIRVRKERREGRSMLSRIHHIGIVTEDTESVLRIFEKALNCKFEKEFAYSGFVKSIFLHFENVQIEITEPNEPGSFYSDMVEEKGTCFSHIAFASEDVEGECDEIAKRGGRFREGFGPGRVTPRGYRIAFIDPDDTEGVQIQLISEKPVK